MAQEEKPCMGCGRPSKTLYCDGCAPDLARATRVGFDPEAYLRSRGNHEVVAHDPDGSPRFDTRRSGRRRDDKPEVES